MPRGKYCRTPNTENPSEEEKEELLVIIVVVVVVVVGVTRLHMEGS